jgi:hypothetical protein
VKEQSSLFNTKSLEDKILQSKQFFGKFYFRLTELVIPREGKTRAEAWKDIMQLFVDRDEKLVESTIPVSPQQQPSTQSQSQSESSSHSFSLFDPMDRKALFQRSWMIGENLAGILAFIYFGYFIFGSFALRYQWGIFTELATNTLQGSTVIPFFAFTFIFICLLIWLREKFTSWSPIRTALLFTSGSLFLIFLALNLLY